MEVNKGCHNVSILSNSNKDKMVVIVVGSRYSGKKTHIQHPLFISVCKINMQFTGYFCFKLKLPTYRKDNYVYCCVHAG